MDNDPQRYHRCINSSCGALIPALGAAVLTSKEWEAMERDKLDAARYRAIRKQFYAMGGLAGLGYVEIDYDPDTASHEDVLVAVDKAIDAELAASIP